MIFMFFRYHLQALRHFYVLAAEMRCIETRDADTMEACYVPLQIIAKDEKNGNLKTIECTSPCILPDFDDITSIKIMGPKYWSRILDIQNNADHKNILMRDKIIFVKKKAGFYEHLEGHRNTLSTKEQNRLIGELIQKSREEFMQSFISDTNVLAFARHFCGESSDPFYSTMLYECLSQEKPEMIQTYLFLHNTLKRFYQDLSIADAWNVKIMIRYYREGKKEGKNYGDSNLIRPTFLEMVRTCLDHKFDLLDFQSNILHKYYEDASFPNFKVTKNIGIDPN
jgi:anaphase-promoting complex subunit 1